LNPAVKRIKALRRFALSITAFTLAGAFLLGFEDSWAQPLTALATAYIAELALETSEAWACRRPLRFDSPITLVDFLLPAHITGLSIALLLYPNDRLWPIVFTTVVAVGSKFLLRAPVGGQMRHFLNPSNLGIAATLVVFPWVGIAPPYHFTENVSGILDWAIPLAVLALGTSLNAQLTGKMPLILGWLGGFVLQAVARSIVFDTPVVAALLPVTGFAVILFTNYMITDPGTTPFRRRNQVAFGLATAATYGLLVSLHIVFGLFFALAIVSGLRGLGLWVLAAHAALGRRPAEAPAGLPTVAR
jgi:Na+-translocating ferredoxin:NAD+ oxidoreductase RnfD subunit